MKGWPAETPALDAELGQATPAVASKTTSQQRFSRPGGEAPGSTSGGPGVIHLMKTATSFVDNE
jgi:hypothetical protein